MSDTTTSDLTIFWYAGQLFVTEVIDEESTLAATVECNDPIDPQSDSWQIAEMVGEELGLRPVSVEHDGQYIHVRYQD